MDLNESLVFVRIIQAGSLTKASKVLGTPKSTLSRKLKFLEDRLGVQLIQRTTRSLRLTAAGEVYFEKCRHAVQDIQEAEAILSLHKAEVEGNIRVTAPPEMATGFFTEILMRFRRLYPQVRIEVFYTERLVSLTDEMIDVAIRFGELADSSLIARKVCEVPASLFASPIFLERRGEPIKPEDLKDWPCLHFSNFSPKPEWELSFLGQKKKYPVGAIFTANNLGSITEMAVFGEGIALLPDYMAEDAVRSGKLRGILKECKVKPAQLHILYPNQRFYAPKIKAFSEFLLKELPKLSGA